ncbi:MAG: hypothetical protein N4A57_08675 [Anaeromicrobium sp.]|jgi:hypothetical protein|uniref:hypothetical protein n=1 Tax=Anaeromicrobium sp. TaxID=1929132 RepID=UPI0025DC638F|nr:hypothetical protein [Anaeromicrobium sp.]MCT4594325.1 hypothetical protein [Anaeromicrobium sp.]
MAKVERVIIVIIIVLGMVYLSLNLGLDNFNSGKTRSIGNRKGEEQKNNIISLPSKNIVELEKVWEFKTDGRV